LRDFLAGFHPEVRADSRGFHLLLDGREVTEEIRSAAASRDASQVAVLPVVRQWVKEHLRYLARNGGVVTEGRDQGTAVFPQAQWKFFLDATLATRAARRRQDWQRDGDPPPLDKIMADLAARDLKDETRSEAPLTVPAGAVVIDTTDLNIDEVVKQCLAAIRGRLDHKPIKRV
jgi:cytidylate kinase